MSVKPLAHSSPRRMLDVVGVGVNVAVNRGQSGTIWEPKNPWGRIDGGCRE
jgi:hypothetical protein